MASAIPEAALPTFSQRVKYARTNLTAAQKPANGVPAYLRWVNRRAGRFCAAYAYGGGLAPNIVTAASATCSLTGLILLLVLPRAVWSGLLVAVILAFGYVLDSADGQLARVYGRPSKAGEWLDHVVDSFRAPAVHAAIAAASMVKSPEQRWLAGCALVFGIVASGQFLSQVLAGALVRSSGETPRRGGNLRSFLLLPTDTGALCWSFALWGFPAAFASVYVTLTLITVIHCAISLIRRYRDLSVIDSRENHNA